MIHVILPKEQLLRLYSKFALASLRSSKCLCVADSLVEMPRIFGKVNLAVHSICDFLVIDLLLNVKFG